MKARLTLLCLLIFGGCNLPRDPEGTLNRATGGTLRVGITEHEPWTRLSDGEPAGVEVELVQEFAKSIDAEIDWVHGTEAELFEALEHFELDMMIGGVKEDTPWSKHVGLTGAYVTLPPPRDELRNEKHVMAVAPGENALLVQLEKRLLGREAEILERLDEESAGEESAEEDEVQP
jgi:polar amino acid transport system substrate-binding protein